MPTTAVIFPFDLFGGGGSAAGAELLADELRTLLADNRRERTPTRAAAYQDQVKLKQVSFESLDDLQAWRERGRRLARQALRDDFFLWVAGNHLGVLPLYDELGDGVAVLQLDAHLDVHNFSDLSPEPSHGNFLMHCAGRLPPLLNVGHRELLLREDHVRKYYREAIPAGSLAVDAEAVLGHVRRFCSAAESIVLDLDWDVLDAAFFPAVSRPVPFGLTPQQLLYVIDAAGPERLRGVALSEFEPGRDRDDRSLGLAMWLIEWLLLKRYERPDTPEKTSSQSG